MNYLVTNNLVFFRIDIRGTFASKKEPKYMAGTLYSGLFPDEIYTLSEIKEKYSDIKEYGSILDIPK